MKQPTVLVVEDEAALATMLRYNLEKHGFLVEEAADGLEGLRKALNWEPDVAVIDIGLPGINGYEVAMQVRAALGTRIRLIALTAYGSDEDKSRALAAGFDAHLTKPADIIELCQQLRSAQAG